MCRETTVLIPDQTFKAAERFARRFGMSRSKLYALALRSFIYEHEGNAITEALDAVYSETEWSLDPLLEELQSASLQNRSAQRVRTARSRSRRSTTRAAK